MAMRRSTAVLRLMEAQRRPGLRYLSDSRGRILGEEERAAENVYIQKMEREKLEKLRQKAEKEKVEKEKAEKTCQILVEREKTYSTILVEDVGCQFAPQLAAFIKLKERLIRAELVSSPTCGALALDVLRVYDEPCCYNK
ncbi:hypothetical protein C3L33_16835, partial [Rhododendron williamsianum]